MLKLEISFDGISSKMDKYLLMEDTIFTLLVFRPETLHSNLVYGSSIGS